MENEGAVSDDGNQDGGYLVLREATVEEKEVELKVQQKIEALKKGEEPVSYCCYCYCSCLIFSCAIMGCQRKMSGTPVTVCL